MARRSLFPIGLTAILLVALWAATSTVAFAQEGSATTETTQGTATTDQPAGADGIERIMNTSDSLSWSTSDSTDEVVVEKEGAAGLMGWFSTTPLGQTGAGKFFVKGGDFMWPLLLFAIVTLAVIMERAWTLARARTNTRRLIGAIITSLRNDGVTAATQVCERTRGPIAAILHSGLLRADRGPEAVEKAIETAGTIEMSFLERGLLALAASANIAPLIGFLGTVSGMIHAFEAIANADQVNAKLVASGISEALITTLTGLVIAIPASVSHSFFLSVIDRFIIEMEESAAELVEELSQVGG